jgi:hypothetical protein
MKTFGQRATGLRLERMQDSPLWADGVFRNIHPVLPGLRDRQAPRPALRDILLPGGRRLPGAPLPSMDPLDTWRRAPGSGLRATWLGHSTVLIEIDGLRVLTDPVWGPRASPSRFMGPKRFQPVPVRLAAMPPVDLVLVSHDHYDHLDYPTIRALAKQNVPFVTPLGVGAHLEAWGVPPRASPSWTGGRPTPCRRPTSRCMRRRRSTSRAEASRTAMPRCGRRWSSRRRATACSSAATRA